VAVVDRLDCLEWEKAEEMEEMDQVNNGMHIVKEGVCWWY